MDNFSELQEVWKGGDTRPAMTAKEIVSLVKRQQRRMLFGVMVTLAFLLATIAMMVSVWIAYKPVYVTTRISLAIIMLAVGGAIVIKSQALRLLFGSVKADASNKAMIESLQRLQQKQRAFNTVGISAYYLLLSIGMALYLAEFVRGNILFGIVAYGLTFGWIAFTWFYLRKRGIERQNAKLDSMISHLKGLHSDWTE